VREGIRDAITTAVRHGVGHLRARGGWDRCHRRAPLRLPSLAFLPLGSGTYTCGDLGYCSQCPDNEYCQGGQPQAAAQAPAQPTMPAKPVKPASAQPQIAKVTRVIDGDTLQINTGEEVRLIGVDTPEAKHPKKPVEYFGKEASAFTKQLVEGKEVRLEYDVQRQDKYQRTLAYVYVGEMMLNAELVRQGYAQVATFPPNVKYQELFLKL
jgi:endonuclease YncB( thermonuclease family)